MNPVAFAEVGEMRNRHLSSTAEHFYDLMLESCERLFENDIEQQVFEDQMRYMFGVKV
jgi:paired amphipathic helix protein Sin3a